MPGSFQSVPWNACVHRLDLGLYSHPKEFLGEVESKPMLTPREKSHQPENILPRGGSNPRRCIKQDSEPNTLPTSYYGPEHQFLVTCHLSLWGSTPESLTLYRFVGLVVKASASRAEDPGFESRLHREFSGVEPYQ